ncbi:hypothetical protein A2V71_01005 [Candidatus Berkelbacteria bacterium RBG_13_40_8]|uniref:Methyltransferase domain-containing protein n=1 Tax=Candidatus Berkelbacteria bacterium RBG_13_40_8 TaxID=1797467 RepID=A0A1F5DNV3_9BACT|nr:MAG: hypothetical protein A2V71_01005 [Candidatus Berkelbacteria bacterium RBG_13_40_8]
MKQWNTIFQEQGKVFTEIQEDMPRVVELLKQRKAHKILDFGCGSGRHLVYLAKNDFEVYGFDIAEEGMKIAQEWLKKENLSANFKVGSIYGKLQSCCAKNLCSN